MKTEVCALVSETLAVQPVPLGDGADMSAWAEWSSELFWETDFQHKLLRVFGVAGASEACAGWVGLALWELPSEVLNGSARMALQDAFNRREAIRGIELT